MAPKAAAPPPEPEVEAEEGDEWESQEVVCAVLDGIVAEAEAAIQEKRVHRKVVPHTVAAISTMMRAAIEGYFVDHDVGEPELAVAPSWEAGSEPIPALIDPWSRGAVPLRRSQPLPEWVEAAQTAPAPARSTLTPRARTPQTNEAGASADPKAIFVAKPPPGAVDPRATVKKSAPIVTASERLKKRLDAEAREEREKLERVKADLKGREYTYDARGNIILMENMAADRLPPFQQQPRLALSHPMGGRGGRKGGKGGAGRGSASAASRLEFGGGATFKQLETLQPPLLESMGVQRGVKLTAGEATKGGEPREFDGDRMTRATFEEFANSSGTFSPRRPLADAAATARDPLGASAGGASSPTPDVSSPPAASRMPAAAAVNMQGVPPALRPLHMPAAFDPTDTDGKGNPHTRERGGMPIKTRLPPPALGATTGHGNFVPYPGGPGSPDALRQTSTTSSASAVAPARPEATLKTSNPALARSMLD